MDRRRTQRLTVRAARRLARRHRQPPNPLRWATWPVL